MYEVVFKCSSCSVHLSASAEDVGYAFDCPACGAGIAVPAGDILFGCPRCGAKLLASKHVAGDDFECPSCRQRVLVPAQGQDVPVSEPPPVVVDALDSAPAEPPPGGDTVPAAEPSPERAPQGGSDHQFMTTWGDYMAAAGLTDDEDKRARRNKTSRSVDGSRP